MIQIACARCGQAFPRTRDARKYCSEKCSNDAKYVTREHRLLRGVDTSAGPDACWPWRGRCMAYGYGLLAATSRHKAETTHRLAWIIANGRDPGDLVVMHTCDNPPCCNPKHLVLGTRTANNRDSKAKGRNARGAKHGNSSLSDSDVIGIRRRRADGEKTVALAAAFGVGQRTINKIVSGAAWKHLPGAPRV